MANKKLNDLEVAEWWRNELFEGTGASPLFCEGSFWFWDGRIWAPESHESVQKRLIELSKLPGLRMNVTGMMKVFEALRVLSSDPSFFAARTPTIALRDKTLQLSRSKSRFVALLSKEHHPALRCRFGFDFDYVGSDAAPAYPEAFTRYLGQLFANDPDRDEKIEILREYLGACLFGVATQFEKVLLLYGPLGSNGKSRLIDFIAKLFKGCSSAVLPSDFNDEYRLAQLAGARVNLLGEVPHRQIKDANLLKQIVSGDTVTARHIYGKPFEFPPVAGHVWALNKLPVVDDAGDAFWRRFIVLKFNRQFAGTTLPADVVKPLLEELPTIVSWCLDGARNLYARGRFEIPKSSLAELSMWQYKADITLAFVTDCTDSTGRTGVGKTYEAFRRWCFKRGHDPIPSLPIFTERMRSCGFNSRRGDTGYVYGLTLKNSENWEPQGDLKKERAKS